MICMNHENIIGNGTLVSSQAFIFYLTFLGRICEPKIPPPFSCIPQFLGSHNFNLSTNETIIPIGAVSWTMNATRTPLSHAVSAPLYTTLGSDVGHGPMDGNWGGIQVAWCPKPWTVYDSTSFWLILLCTMQVNKFHDMDCWGWWN